MVAASTRLGVSAAWRRQDDEPSWADIRPAPETRAIVAEPGSRKIDAGAGAAGEPSAAGVVGWTLVVLALVAGAAVLARRILRRTALLAGGDAIRVVARRALAPRQDLFLVDVGPRVFLIGSTRDRLVTLGEFARPDEVAQLRARLAPDGPAEQEFRAAVRETLREGDRPRPPASPFAAVAEELSEIRKTVDGWRA